MSHCVKFCNEGLQIPVIDIIFSTDSSEDSARVCALSTAMSWGTVMSAD
jgi:hypothetical protein